MCDTLIEIPKVFSVSNNNLHKQISIALQDVREGKVSPKVASLTLRNNGRALEGMPYTLIKEMESLAMDLEIAEWYENENCFPDLDTVLLKTEEWLKKIPLSM